MSYLATTDFLDDKDFVDRYLYTMRTGNLDLSWMNAATEHVEVQAANKRRGLTFRDLDVGTYGYTELPAISRGASSLAPRGAEEPAGLPDMNAGTVRKADVWAYNIEGYYEEAMSRQWNAATDIPWKQLCETELAEDIGKAYSQLLTFLTEVEMIATDVPSKWLSQISSDYFEVKNFIATQCMDEARHAEVFRKRALTTGYGLMKASPQNERNLKFLREADSFAEASTTLHLQAEGFVLTMFRFSEYLSPTDGDKKLFRLVMQDEARHVGYGMQHLKWHLENAPESREIIHRHLAEAENFIFGGIFAPEVLESFVILAGKGSKHENIRAGVDVVNRFAIQQVEEYFERLDKCGMPERRERSTLWQVIEMAKAGTAANHA
ncbi:MAG TPA: hypothetical protein VN634_12170 [Candidatus Limnocylindrales bacterium]|nr:hypothetical protein [Candidatus Limnocylindrales bacterium]